MKTWIFIVTTTHQRSNKFLTNPTSMQKSTIYLWQLKCNFTITFLGMLLWHKLHNTNLTLPCQQWSLQLQCMGKWSPTPNARSYICWSWCTSPKQTSRMMHLSIARDGTCISHLFTTQMAECYYDTLVAICFMHCQQFH